MERFPEIGEDMQLCTIDNGGTWRVENVIPYDGKTLWMGGGYYVEVRKNDCKIVKIGFYD